MPEQVSFSVALEAAKNGRPIQRIGWARLGMGVWVQYPDTLSKMTLPYLYCAYPDDDASANVNRCPWNPSHADILAEDWVIL